MTSKRYLVSQFVCWGFKQGDGAEVCRFCVLFGQLGGQGLVGDLDQRLQVFQDVVDPVLGDGLSMPVIKILNIYSQGMNNVKLKKSNLENKIVNHVNYLLLSPLPLNVLATMQVGLPLTC